MLFLQIVGSTILVGLISLTGVLFLVRKKIDIQKATVYFISLASGSLLGTAFFHLIPEALEKSPSNTFLLVGLGVFIFFVLEKLLIWRHCHLHQHHENYARPTAARLIILGNAAHNFLDGLIIAASFSASPAAGVAAAAAIVLHEIPQELGDFAILIHGGFPVPRAVAFNVMTGVFAVIGATATYFFVDLAPRLENVLLPVTGGGFLYIALADLIPQLHEPMPIGQTLAQIALLLGGFGSIVLLKHHG
ncbi:MAG: ZIP family metal transporter [Elusimicrobia bacterium]|nr:ZIP family metal transporter [Elusimicrobiota bacterium]